MTARIESRSPDVGAKRRSRVAAFKHAPAMGLAARVGMASRALIYGLLCAIVVRVTVGADSGVGSDVDQDSSLQLLGRSVVGALVLWALAAAVLCYFLWRLTEAWLGTSDPGGQRPRARVQAAVEGAAYLPFGWVAVAVAVGDQQTANQGRHYRGLAASVIRTTAGRVILIAVGAVVVAVGVFFLVQGLRRSFRGHFDWNVMPPWARMLTQASGSIGSVCRGLVFVLAGGLVVFAAITLDPRKAGGVDSALDTLAGQPYGRWMLSACAVGFASFAVFALCEAIWRRTGSDDPLGAETLHT